jgi:hypothetical protein
MEINQIISKVDDVLLESNLELLLQDPFIECIVRYNHQYIESKDSSYFERKHRNHIMLFLRNLYDNFKFLMTNIDDYESLVNFFCNNQSQNIRYLDAMVLHYDVPNSSVLDMFFNRVHKQMDDSKISSYSYEYKKKQFKDLTNSFVQLNSLPDTKIKLSAFIRLEAAIKSVYLSTTFQDKGDDLLIQVNIQIQKLQKLLDLGLLHDAVSVAPIRKKVKSTSKIAVKRKSDFIKIISAMYDAKIFENEKGEVANNKQKLIEDLGSFLNDDLSNYSVSLSQAKTRDEKTYMKPFKEIETEALRYFNAVGEE